MTDLPGLAIVSTPLQWINAQEAIHEFELDGSIIVVLSRDYQKSAFAELPCSSRLAGWRFYQAPGKNEARPWRRLKRGRRSFQEGGLVRKVIRELPSSNPETLILGHSRDVLHRAIGNSLSAARYLLVDDGAQIMNTIEDFRNSELQAPSKKFGTRILEYLAKLDTTEFPTCELFTAYDVIEPSLKIHANRYEWLRTYLRGKMEIRDEVWIVGQYFYQFGMMKAEDYFENLVWLVEQFYSKYQVSYILHPRETWSVRLERLSDYGVKPLRLCRSIELEILFNMSCPDRIATYYSSVFQNSQAMFGNVIGFDIVDPEPAQWQTAHARQLVGPPYRYLRAKAVNPHRLLRPRISGDQGDAALNKSQPSVV